MASASITYVTATFNCSCVKPKTQAPVLRWRLDIPIGLYEWTRGGPGPNRASAFMTNLYHAGGQQEQALRFAAPYNQRIIALFTKGEPKLVFEGFFELAHNLAGIGDRARALCVLQAWRWRNLDPEVIIESERISVRRPSIRDKGPVEWMDCDGFCGRTFTPVDNINICCKCWADVCDDCVNLAGTKEATAPMCNSRDAWLSAPPVVDWTCGPKQSMYNGQVADFDEFLKEVSQ